MPYATRTNMEERFGIEEMIQITDREAAGQFDADTFATAQADGDGEIDSYLQRQYTLPLQSVPPVLVRIACDIYRYYLYGARVTELVETRYNNAVKFLLGVSKGDIQLVGSSGQEPAAATSAGGPSFSAEERVFTRAGLKDY